MNAEYAYARGRSMREAKSRGIKANRWRFRATGKALPYEPLGYLQAGSPSPAVETVGFVVFMPIPQTVPASCVCEFVAVQ
jgi:hypothetical protein